MAANARAARLAKLCAASSITLAACLAVAVPYRAGRNTDMQGLLLLILGALAWCAVLLTYRRSTWPLPKIPTVLLGIFLTCCVTSTLLNPHLSYNLLGSPYIRLGAPGLVACIGFGLLLMRVPLLQLVTFLYFGIVGISLISVPYTLFRLHDVTRIGGVFAQADIFAVFLACGLLIGGYLLQRSTFNRFLMLAAQLLLLGLLLLTATRVAVALIVVLYPLSQQFGPRPWKPRRLLAYAGAVVLLLIGGQAILPARYTNVAYAGESVSYRQDLQLAALQATAHKPLHGYGTGNLADALDCRTLHADALQKTCHEGYFFNSSHNIFIDRVLAVGWIGGIAYVGFAVTALYKGLRSSSETRIVAFCALLIALYYLTNVTSLTLELLFWVLLFQCLRSSTSRA